jgi:hypothetical protein
MQQIIRGGRQSSLFAAIIGMVANGVLALCHTGKIIIAMAQPETPIGSITFTFTVDRQIHGK